MSVSRSPLSTLHSQHAGCSRTHSRNTHTCTRTHARSAHCAQEKRHSGLGTQDSGQLRAHARTHTLTKPCTKQSKTPAARLDLYFHLHLHLRAPLLSFAGHTRTHPLPPSTEYLYTHTHFDRCISLVTQRTAHTQRTRTHTHRRKHVGTQAHMTKKCRRVHSVPCAVPYLLAPSSATRGQCIEPILRGENKMST